MIQTRDFLFEIGTEEMPSAPLINAEKQFVQLLASELDAAGLSHGAVRIISSPRRLAAVVDAVSEATEPVHEVKRGPAASIAFNEDGTPSKAAEGFARKFGIAPCDLIRREDSDGREYVFAETDIPSESAVPLLSRICEQVIAKLEWPNYRSQRWGTSHQTFVRPIRWLCVLFGDEVVSVHYADVISANTTRGHRVLGPGEHEVPNPAAYEQVLEKAGVLSAARRREVIAEGIRRIEQERVGVRVETPKKVLDEVVNLCEWPSVLVGTFDEEFLSVPHEIICESMLSNQRYFPIYDSENRLTREFVIVGNGRPECADTIVGGNERVVRARLFDAKFFYEEDLKVSLEEFRTRLASVAFQEKLGTMLQKSDRITALAAYIAREAAVDVSVAQAAKRAAYLAKADLVSSAVIEFTSQQGVMGAYYALAAGEDPAVAHGIRDHYRPRFAGDDLPESTEGCIVAVADKLDTIVGMFAIDEPPTGSKDPYALRRGTIGVLNILNERLGCGYENIVKEAMRSYAEQGLTFDTEEVFHSICSFIHGRMEQMARDEGISPDAIGAVSSGPVTVPVDFFNLLHALECARKEDAETFDNLATAFARANNLRDAALGSQVDESLMNEVERALYRSVVQVETHITQAMESGNFAEALGKLASLRMPIDLFFEQVKVMDDDVALRENHLRLLNRFVDVFAHVADFGQLAKQ